VLDDTPPLRTTWHGDPALLYRVGDLVVVVLPQRGGKLASIVYRDREWLTQVRDPLIPREALPSLLVDGDMFGWDECAPTIDDCEVLGQRLPLHGDAWDQPWSEHDGWLAVDGRHLGYTLRRHLSINPNGFRLDYLVTAPERIPFLWAAHPQFAAEPGTQVMFGDGTPGLIDIFDRGFWRDSLAGAPIHLSDVPPNRSAKLFVDPERAVDRAQLVHPDGARMTFHWDATVAPYLGVWMDRASIGPVDAIAIEPMTGYADSCAAAVAANRVLWLKPFEPVRWWLEVSFSAADLTAK
jgi:galactose mutarotase-like enzyme